MGCRISSDQWIQVRYWKYICLYLPFIKGWVMVKVTLSGAVIFVQHAASFTQHVSLFSWYMRLYSGSHHHWASSTFTIGLLIGWNPLISSLLHIRMLCMTKTWLSALLETSIEWDDISKFRNCWASSSSCCCQFSFLCYCHTTPHNAFTTMETLTMFIIVRKDLSKVWFMTRNVIVGLFDSNNK